MTLRIQREIARDAAPEVPPSEPEPSDDEAEIEAIRYDLEFHLREARGIIEGALPNRDLAALGRMVLLAERLLRERDEALRELDKARNPMQFGVAPDNAEEPAPHDDRLDGDVALREFMRREYNPLTAAKAETALYELCRRALRCGE